MSLSPELRRRVLDAAAEAPSPTRAETVAARLRALAAATAGALAIFWLFVRHAVHATERPPAAVAITSLGTAVIGAIGVYVLTTSPRRSMLRRPSTTLLAAALFSTVGLLVWRSATGAAFGLDQVWPAPAALRCLALGVATGALPLSAALASWRRTEPTSPGVLGAAFGAAAGLGGAVLVDLACPISTLPHQLVGHVLPIAVLASLGAAFGWRILRVRRR
jgi:hypothetical protein